MQLRDAREADLPAIRDIVNHVILHSTANLELEPHDLSYWQAWLTSHTGIHPALVAQEEGEKGEVVAYASLSPLYAKAGYRNAAELSLYVKEGLQGRGIGRLMMQAILDLARKQGEVTTVISKITAGNAASDALHQAFGFVLVGTYHDIGRKFGRFVDVNIFQIML